MAPFARSLSRAALVLISAALLLSFVGGAQAQTASPSSAQAERGAYIFHAAGCENCHTDVPGKGASLAGGRALKTPFGTFRTPNITPDAATGIGKWSEADFIRALRDGRAPNGDHYFPAFPYTAYTKMTDADMKDLRAYIFTLPAVAKPNMPHELNFPYNIRLGVMVWKWLNFTPGPLPVADGKDAAWARGRYLVEAVSHCAECHTPRDRLGGLVTSMWMAGSKDGAEGEGAPNITPDPATGIGEWAEDDLAFALKVGMAPTGDTLGSLMADVVENGTSKLTDADLAAMATYLKSLPPIVHKP